ncbi:MAG: MFS transporter [Candidatus Vogelbacteria bacterium]|nr:MFS transporter [Candidatus Vogelbacteria bacterium]
MVRDSQGIKEGYGSQRPLVYVFSLSVLFFSFFDSVMSYLMPLLIEEHGFSKSMIGLIIGSSSIATLSLFLFAVAVWGIYYDLLGFGVFNFVGRYTKKEDHASNFGIIQIFRAVGGILAPLVVGLTITSDKIDWKSFTVGYVFLSIGFAFFLILLFMIRRRRRLVAIEGETVRRKKNLFIELHLWEKIGRQMLPVLVLTFYLFFIEAFFWTLAPLYAESSGLEQFGGLFLTAFSLPALLVGWFVGGLTKHFGKKRIAYA